MALRILAAVAVLVSAAVHLALWFDGVRYQYVIGPAFIVNVIGGVLTAILLVFWRHWVPPLIAVVLGASPLGAFVIAATVGLFGIHDHWEGAAVWTAAVSEVIAILAGVAVLVRLARRRSQA